VDRYDLAVIGGGSAGQTAAIIAGRVGAKVLLVDRDQLGGDCLHHGCVPSKALIRCAKVAHTMAHGDRFGVSAEGVKIDFAQVMGHVRQAIETVGAGETVETMATHGVTVAFGGARFLSPTRLQVGEQQIEATRSIIAVGSRPVAPPIPGLAKAGTIDHVGLFESNELAERLVVLGGGPIGVEMGQALARLGARVTILQAGERILDRDDPELAERLQGYLQEELTLLCGARMVEVVRSAASAASAGGKTVVYEHQGEQHRIECDQILVAVGRKPNLEELDLGAAGVTTAPRGVVVDDYLRTSAKNIWACGDCVGSLQFTHFAEAQARIAARNALFMGCKKFNEPWVPWCTFSDPELAHVGMLEADALRQHPNAKLYRFDYADLDRAICEGSARGLAKVVCTPKGRILGASLLGPHAGEAISELTVAMKAGLSLTELSNAIHVYPTMNRIVRRLGDQRFFERGVGSATRRLFGQFKGLGRG
jgi:pyruvate/2-oxoglutarate dehydrogenase complex dihydrolipoamide dehydrogenase (E3) component